MNIFKVLLVILTLTSISCERIEYASPPHLINSPGEWQTWPIDSDWQIGDQVIHFINEYRTSQGLDVLTKDAGLSSALAAQHCNYMIYTQQMSHDGFEYRAETMIRNGAETVAENVAFGYNDPYEVVNAWIDSPAHKKVLEGNYNYAGLGIRKDVFGTNFFTLILYRK